MIRARKVSKVENNMTSKKHRRRTKLISNELCFYAWGYAGSLRKATKFLAYYDLRPRPGLFDTNYIVHQTIKNNALKSEEWKEYCQSRGTDNPEMNFTLMEEDRAKQLLPGLIKANIQRLVDLRDKTLVAPYRKMVEMGIIKE